MSQPERRYHLTGWILFMVCAVFFIGSAVLSGDVLYLVGSVIFFIACIIFVIPLISTGQKRVTGSTQRSTQDHNSETMKQDATTSR